MPIQVTDEQGRVHEFPDGTSPDAIREVLIGASGTAAPHSAAAPTPGGALVAPDERRVTTPNSGLPAAPAGQGQGPAVTNGTTRIVYDANMLNRQQRRAMEEFYATQNYNPQAAPGTPQNPVFVSPGTRPPAGASYFDEQGQLHAGDLSTAPSDESLGFRMGALNPLLSASNWAYQGLEGLVGRDTAAGIDRTLNGVIGLPPTPDLVRGHLEARRNRMLEGYRPGEIGQGVGDIVGNPGNWVRNPWLAGALGGTLGGSPDRPVDEVAVDAVTGTALSGGAHTALRGAGAVVAPSIRPAVREARREGIRMTPGMILGGGVRRTESVLREFPFIGDMIRRHYDESLDDFNRAGANRTLGPLGESVPADAPVGHPLAQHVQYRFNEAYDAITPQIRWTADGTFATNVRDILVDARANLEPRLAQRLGDALRREVMGRRSHGTGTLDGQAYRDSLEGLRREADNYFDNGSPAERDYAEALRSIASEVRDQAARSSPPEVTSRLAAIDEGFSNRTRLDQAGAGTPTGAYTPSELRSATLSQDISARDNASAAGRARMQDLATMGEDVLPPAYTRADQGNARTLINLAGAAAMYGGISKFHPDPAMLMAGAGTLLPFTGAGRDFATRALMDRPAWAPYVRSVIDGSSGVAGRAAGVAGHVDRENQRLNNNVVDGIGR